MKSIDVTSYSYAEYNGDFNKKDPKSKVGDHVRISKYKGYAPNWSQEVFVVSKNTVPWTYVVNDLNGEEITGSFYKKLKKRVKKNLEQKKYLKKGDNCISNGKAMIVFLIVKLMKKDLI